tara:strand:+ start:1937 stop:2179 length:243 start_codon:yes stop_codon:yes gene_type:complete
MQNLWQRLKPAYKKSILSHNDEYPYLVNTIKQELESERWWRSVSVSIAQRVCIFTHDSILDASMNDVLYGEKFFKKLKTD